MTLPINSAKIWRLKLLKSAPFRSLQYKSQALPLHTQPSAHNRLTHSLEVAHFSEQLAIKAAKSTPGHIECIELAGLVHDIGIPPFGHTGEQSIRDWCKTHGAYLARQATGRHDPLPMDDFFYFDGNAQGMRILMKYPFAGDTDDIIPSDVLAAYLKYPHVPNAQHRGAGYFTTERAALAARLPFLSVRTAPSYLVELADDVAHTVGDLEDCIDNNWISFTHFVNWMRQHAQGNLAHYVLAMLPQDHSQGAHRLYFHQLAAQLLDEIAQHYVACYGYLLDNIADSFLDHSCIDFISLMKQYISRFVFSHADKIRADLAGYHMIQTVLNAYSRFLQLPRSTVIQLLHHDDYAIIHTNGLTLDYKLASLLSKEWLEVYLQAADPCDDRQEWRLRMHLVLDTVTAMSNQELVHFPNVNHLPCAAPIKDQIT